MLDIITWSEAKRTYAVKNLVPGDGNNSSGVCRLLQFYWLV